MNFHTSTSIVYTFNMRLFHFIFISNLYFFVHTTQTPNSDTQVQPNNLPESTSEETQIEPYAKPTNEPASNNANDNFQFDYELEDHNDNPETGQHNAFTTIRESFLLLASSSTLHLPFHGILDGNRYRYNKNGWEFEIYLCPAEKKEEKQLINNLSRYFKSAKYCLIQKRIPKDEPKLCKNEVRPVLMKRDPPGWFNKSPTHIYQFVYQNCDSIETMTKWLNNKSGCLTDFVGLLPGDRVRKPEISIFKLYKVKLGKYKTGLLIRNDKSAVATTYDTVKRDATTPGNGWPMYELSYHTKEQRTIFTKHFIMTPQLLSDIDSLPQPSFDITKISTESYDLKNNRFAQMHSAFQQQENSPYQMVPQLMVPIEDFAIDHWKKTTLHYINVSPLWLELQPLMYMVNDRVRKMAISITQKIFEADETELKLFNGFFICTMVFDSPKVQIKDKLYLGNDQTFPISNVWIKMVYFLNNQLGIAIVIHNTPNDPPTNKICNHTIRCDFKRWFVESDTENVISYEIAQYGYCCKIDYEIQKLFATTFPIDGVLEINTMEFNI